MAAKGQAFIINLDDEGNPGTHWTAARYTCGTLYYADPFGTFLNGWPPAELMPIADQRIVNNIVFQRPQSKLCGYYAICFARAMNHITSPISQKEFEQLLYNSIA
jgi:hypothetical protein